MNSPISQYLRVRFPDADHATLTALAGHSEVAQAVAALDTSIESTLSALQQPGTLGEDQGDAAASAEGGETNADIVSQDVPVPSLPQMDELDATPAVPQLGEVDSVETGATCDVDAVIEPVVSPLDRPAVETAEMVPPVLEPESPAASRKVGVGAPPVPAAAPSVAPSLIAVPAIQFALRNLRQGEPGEIEVTTVPEGQDFELVGVRFTEGLGLEFDAVRKRIFGTPKLDGEFKLALQYRASCFKDAGVRSTTVNLLVNPDPKSLWRNLPTDPNDVFWKEDSAQCVVEGPTRRIIAARQRGRSHAHVGSFCEDDYHVAYLENGWYITVVADGAGSAKYSRRGSKIACEAAAGLLKELLGGDAGEGVLTAARELVAGDDDNRARNQSRLDNALFVTIGYAAHAAMKAHRDELDSAAEVTSLRELATTLLIGVNHEVDGRQLCAAYWVGDGAVGVYQADQRVHILGDVDSGEYSGQTRFLDPNEVTQDALLKRLRFVLVDDFTAFILMTDGVSDAKFETEARLQQCDSWDALWADLETGAQLSLRDEEVDDRLQRWLEFWSAGNHDDRTIAILY